MELRRLRYFLAVAEELHFTRAAERMGMRQPPLSAQIRELEKELGVLLFHRRSRGVELTEAGKLLVERAREILREADRAVIDVQRRARGETGSLSIGFAGATYLVTRIPAIMRCYVAEHPGIELRTTQSNTVELVKQLLEGSLDAAFIRMPIADSSGLRLEPIITEKMVAVLPHGHPLYEAAEVTLKDLAKDTFTLPPRRLGPGYDSVIAAMHTEAGCAPQIGQEATVLTAIPSMVAAGCGVSVVPRSLDQLRIDHVVYRPIAGTKLRAAIMLAFPRSPCPTAVKLMAVARRVVADADAEEG